MKKETTASAVLSCTVVTVVGAWDRFQSCRLGRILLYRYRIGTRFGVAGVSTKIGSDLHLAKV